MCERYYDCCSEKECINEAKKRYEDTIASGERNMSIMEEYFRSRSGYEYFLWRGASQPCKHIIADHGSECNVVKKTKTEYGMLFDTCNCEKNEDNTYEYY